MKERIRTLLLAGFVAVGTLASTHVQHAFASDNSGLVSQIWVQNFGGTNNAGLFFFRTATMTVPTGSCNTDLRYVVDLGKEGGRAIQSFVMGASLAGRAIFVDGVGGGPTNACTLWATSESVNSVRYYP